MTRRSLEDVEAHADELAVSLLRLHTLRATLTDFTESLSGSEALWDHLDPMTKTRALQLHDLTNLIGEDLDALDEIERSGTDFATRWNAAAQGHSTPLRTPAPPAMFTPVDETRAAYRSGRDQRQTARLIRRMQRKDAQGLPQRYRDVLRAEQKGLRHGPLV